MKNISMFNTKTEPGHFPSSTLKHISSPPGKMPNVHPWHEIIGWKRRCREIMKASGDQVNQLFSMLFSPEDSQRQPVEKQPKYDLLSFSPLGIDLKAIFWIMISILISLAIGQLA